MSSSSLGIILLENREEGQRVVKLRSIWHWKLQLQEERGTGAALRPKGGTAAKTRSAIILICREVREMDQGRKQENVVFTW